MRYLLQTIRPVVEDLAGTATFYLLFLATGSAPLAAAVGLGIGLMQIAVHLRRRTPVPALLAVGVVLTVALGAVTLVTADPRFLLVKPSIVYAAVGLTMLPRGWVRRYVPPIALPLLPARTFDLVGWGWAALILGTALLNLVLVAMLPPVRAAAAFVLWGVASKLALFGGQYALLYPRARRAAIDQHGRRR
ncbi:septation protein IspZ [Sphingomonas sp.]|uniref:septation protein IspZ n=1 Tax=Sphingomonas sp. TaxID=28214 RepID=UPI003CC60582